MRGGSATPNNGLKTSKYGQRADHLLNFSYAPLPSQEPGRGRFKPQNVGWRSVKARSAIMTKEQFLQANCQFIVKESLTDEFVQYISDADKMVEWDLIEQLVSVSS